VVLETAPLNLQLGLVELEAYIMQIILQLQEEPIQLQLVPVVQGEFLVEGLPEERHHLIAQMVLS
jgi:hypothetical protein